MKSVLQSTWPLFFGIAMIMVGNGLQGTLLGVRATLEGWNTATTGLIMSLYYGGFLAGSVLAPMLVQNVGHIRVFTALASLASTTALLHGLFVDPYTWALARIIAGFSFAGLYIVVESWLNDVSSNESRGKILGSYMLTFYGAMVIGQFMLNISSPEKIELFILTSILISLALMPISLSKRPAPEFDAPTPTNIKEVYNASPLGVTSVFISGMACGLLFAMAPVYATQIGMGIHQIANFMAVFVMGGMFAQLPIGYLSDRLERRKLITLVALMSCATALACFVFSENQVMLYVLFFVLGTVSLSIYSICVAYTNDHLEREKYVGACSLLILLNGAGSFIGPFIGALFMTLYGIHAFFPVIAVIYLLIYLFALYRAYMTPAMPIEEQSDLLAMPPRATPMMAQIAEETEDGSSYQ